MSEKQGIQKVADLACLKIEEGKVSQFEEHFDKILQYFNNLSTLDTSSVEPMVTPHEVSVSLRKDEVKKDLEVSEVLENAPDLKDSLFKVPPVV